ncbi:MAG TPA: RNA-binding protein S1 [Lachnospiraceae bacterium]|jgi:Predicted RNA binding protein (contains ribosomal protein S1 domain)|nr:RNA-binding protein S1 [Lachnospiraceae bacterium]
MSEHVVGSIVEGKVIKITPFGAIVAIDGGGQGLVHISQIANSFVQDINDHLKVNDTVKVKIMTIDAETKRISLSIRAALPKPERPERPERTDRPQRQPNFKPRDQKPNYDRHNDSQASPQPPLNEFEERMKDFLKQSNDKMASLNKRANKR